MRPARRSRAPRRRPGATRSIHGAHVARSPALAHSPAERTHGRHHPSVVEPSRRGVHAIGESASPARCIAANNTSPERSPVNTRPVRLPPLAAGASPTIKYSRTRGTHPDTGRPQYGWSANDFRLVTADSSRHSHQPLASPAHRHLCLELLDGLAAPGHRTTCARLTRPPFGGRRIAGPPLPGGTGESKRSPVRGWARFTSPLCTNGARQVSRRPPYDRALAADALAGLIAELPEGMVVTDPAITELPQGPRPGPVGGQTDGGRAPAAHRRCSDLCAGPAPTGFRW